ncbi:hypothetical protein UUC_18030, partial [Rhodanobacter denitrificans]
YASNLKDIYDALAQNDEGTGDLLEMQVRPELMLRMDSINKLMQAQSDEVKQLYQTQVGRYKLVRALVLAALLGGL